MDSDSLPGQTHEESERVLLASNASILDNQQVEKEIAEKGYLTLPVGTRVALRVAVKTSQDSPGYFVAVGGSTSQAPIECTVSAWGGESINPEQPESVHLGLSLSSASLRRLDEQGKAINSELNVLLPELPEDEQMDLEAQIKSSPNPERIRAVILDDLRVTRLKEREKLKLYGDVLIQNPSFRESISNSPFGSLEMVGLDLSVGTSKPLDIQKLAPSQSSPLPPPIQ